jgi:ubiquinone/menaquinone biosynthesis C-methylase UbiE
MSITDPSRVEVASHLIFSRLFRKHIYHRFVTEMNLEGDENVLDFGAGWGDGAFYIANQLNRGGRVTLLDVSTTWQRVARKRLRRFTNMDFVNSNIFSCGLPDESYDLIVIHYVLHDIDSSERQATIQELARKLKPHGSIWLREPTKKPHGMSVEEIRRLLSRAYLKEISSTIRKSQYVAQLEKGQ